jgi:hypothetical protein
MCFYALQVRKSKTIKKSSTWYAAFQYYYGRVPFHYQIRGSALFLERKDEMRSPCDAITSNPLNTGV